MAKSSTGWNMSAMKNMVCSSQTPLHWLLVSVCIFATCKAATTESMPQPLVRIAELNVDPAQLEAYTSALKEEISTSIRVEPGVLTLYAVGIKDHPNQIRIFETYADQAAYEAHVQSLHFKKYKSETQGMVRSLKLFETSPILLGAKTRQH
jgi:quinol monooxygenase YgiN